MFEVKPLNATAVVPVKPEPLTVTLVPTGPEVGENDVITGPAPFVVTVKLVELVPVPSAFATAIGPVVAPTGTVAWMLVSLTTVKLRAAVLLNVTPVAPVKFVPVIWTFVPTGPLVGVNDVTVGGLPPPVVTV